MKKSWRAALSPLSDPQILLRVAYDCVGSVLALVLAFSLRLIILIYQGLAPSLIADAPVRYLRAFSWSAPLFVFYTVVCLWALGLYQTPSARDSRLWRPIKILAGVSLIPLLWSSSLYFLAPEYTVPRGVSLLAWGFLLVIAGVPRILKYYVLRKGVIDIHMPHRKIKNVLVIGGAGYIGSVLCRVLINGGYRVRVLDSLLFNDAAIRSYVDRGLIDLHVGDFRNVENVVRAVRGMDAVIHLGGVVGDPACSVDDDFTIDVNLTATAMLGEVCKVFKIQKFIFASTCSVYGASQVAELTEESELNPLSLYAKTKIASERVLMAMANESFQPTILRFATIFGMSPRPRFDLVVNLLTARAVKEGKISVFGGRQWRPFIHVSDVAHAMRGVLEAPLSVVGGQVFNVGSDELNYQIIGIAKQVEQAIPGTEVEVVRELEDNRDYRVSFKKFASTVGTPILVRIEDGIREIRDAYARGEFTDYANPQYSNVKQTQRILRQPTEAQPADQDVPMMRMGPRSMLNQTTPVESPV